MSMVQAILLGVLYWIEVKQTCRLSDYGQVQKPLVCGWIAQASSLRTCTLTGAMVGASINLDCEDSFQRRVHACRYGFGRTLQGLHLPAITPVIWMPIQLLHWLFNRSSGYTGMVLPYDLWLHLLISHRWQFVEKEQYNKIWIANVLLPQIMAAVICRSLLLWLHISGATYIQGFITMPLGTPLKIFTRSSAVWCLPWVSQSCSISLKGKPCISVHQFVVAVYSDLHCFAAWCIVLIIRTLVYVGSLQRGSGKGNIFEESQQQVRRISKWQETKSKTHHPGKNTYAVQPLTWNLGSGAAIPLLERMMGMVCGHLCTGDDLYKDDRTEPQNGRGHGRDRFFNVHIQFIPVFWGWQSLEEPSLGGAIPGAVVIPSLKTSIGPLAGIGDTICSGGTDSDHTAICIDITLTGTSEGQSYIDSDTCHQLYLQLRKLLLRLPAGLRGYHGFSGKVCCSTSCCWGALVMELYGYG